MSPGDMLADAGKAETDVFLWSAIVIGILLFFTASYCLIHDTDDTYDSAKGTVNNPKCVKSTTYDSKGRAIVSYKCAYTMSYSYKDKPYTKAMTSTTNAPMMKNETVNISINKNNPNDIIVNRMSDETVAIILCVVGIFAILIAGAKYYMTHHSRMYAQMEGAEVGIEGVQELTKML